MRMTTIEELDLLRSVLEHKKAQEGLIQLYSQSQSECTRNGALGMEIGMAREKDQGAVLKLFLGDILNLDIDNELPEDFMIKEAKISAKHSSGKLGSPVKAKWTSADTSVQEAVKKMIEAEDSYYPHLLLTYIDTATKTITFLCISAEHNRRIIKEMKEEAFTIPKGNSRGIEYSRKAMKALMASLYFRVQIDHADVKGGVNPIDRRIQFLRSIGIGPTESLLESAPPSEQ
jgi:hypothetical protein